MASSGTISKSFATGYALEVRWRVNSQNIAANTSNVTAELWLVAQPTYNIVSSAQKDVSLTINGVAYYGKSLVTIPKVNYVYNRKLFEATANVDHSANGSKACEFSGTANVQVTLNGIYYSSASASGTGYFNTIPRASTPTLSSSSVAMGSDMTIYTNKLANFTHRIRWQFGKAAGTIATGVVDSTTWTLPLATLAAQVPSKTTGVGSIFCDTYSGATLIGTKTVGFTASVPASVVPSYTSLNVTRIDNGVPPGWGVYVQGKSKVKLDIVGAAGAYGSTITAYWVGGGGGFSASAASLTTGVIQASGNITFTGKIADSRGRTATKTTTVAVVAYSPPAITSVSRMRCLADGTPDDAGTYIRVLTNFNFSTVSGKNTATTAVSYKKTTDTTWTGAGTFSNGVAKIIGGGLIDIDSGYDVRVSVTDAFTTVTNLGVVSTAFTTMDFRKGGKGIAIGKVSEVDDLFDVSFPTRFRDMVTVDGNLAVEGVITNVPVRTNLTLAASVTTSYAYVEAHCGRAHLYLNFQVKDVTLSNPYDLVTLPAALRPSTLMYVTGATNAGLAVILAILKEGQIRVMPPSIPANAYVNLSASWAL